MFTEKLGQEFSTIKQKYGSQSLNRIEQMLSNRNHVHLLQKECKYVLPGLISKPWRRIDEFIEIQEVVGKLEQLHEAIKIEIAKIAENDGLIEYNHYKGRQKDWKALYLFRNGQEVTENFQLVPTTAKFMSEELKNILCPLGEMHYSVMQPGAKIAPHCDLWNFSLNLHFAVEIPDLCGIQVAGETRQWQEGKCLLFDYSYIHEAWNNSDKIRICLLMDIWNPELTLAEKEGVVALITEVRKLMEN